MKEIYFNTFALVGLSETEAMQRVMAIGGQFLVLSRDGIPLTNRTDRRTDRVCVDIVYGKVKNVCCI